MSDLKPCPFCGHPAEYSESRDGDLVNVRCSRWNPGTCLGQGPNKFTQADAADAWNRRVIPPGYVLVPEEPTEKMMLAGWKVSRHGIRQGEQLVIWRAMLAAAKTACPKFYCQSGGCEEQCTLCQQEASE